MPLFSEKIAVDARYRIRNFYGSCRFFVKLNRAGAADNTVGVAEASQAVETG